MARWQLFASVAVLIACTLSGCSKDDDPDTGASGSGPTESSSSAESSSAPSTTAPPEITPDCELAARNWMRTARDQYADGVFGVRIERPDSAGGPADRVLTYCPDGWARAVTGTNYELALLNAQLHVCVSVPANCDEREIDHQLDKVQRGLERVQLLLDNA